ncbi:helix-turn-helix domain-containing protein [Sorangium sp. So ce388]|uniref:helix-turn-helix domain-containing protein n=1 Tax=Sorangium sp. So ce388 TaxID=3133309 RepID=UPI003F5C5C44
MSPVSLLRCACGDPATHHDRGRLFCKKCSSGVAFAASLMEAAFDPSSPEATVPQRIQYAMSALGFTQAQLMRGTGFNSGYVSRLRERPEGPRPDGLRKIKKALGVTYDWLLDGVGPMLETSPERAPLAASQVADGRKAKKGGKR